MLDPITIHQPNTVEEASEMLSHFGPDAAVYAGGTELLVVLKERLAEFQHLIDIKQIPGLREIAFDGDVREVRIGALATHRDIERSPAVREHVPALAALAGIVANVRVRSAGTLGGNLCFAEPHSDPATLLAALGARFTLASAAGTREVAAEDFTTGLMETQRRHDEILTLISVPKSEAGVGVAYERFKLHERPTAAVAAVIAVADGVITGARIVAGSVGDRPQRLPETEAALTGQLATPDTTAAAAEGIRNEVDTMGDAFESEAYRRQLASTTGRRAIAAAIRRATGEEGGRHAA